MSLRIIVKRDDESRVGRGAVLFAAHFRPEIALIVHAVARAAEAAYPALVEMWITEGHRTIRPSRDLHKEMRAMDFTFRYDDGAKPSPTEYANIVWATKERLGEDYTVLNHGEGMNHHIHCELDPH